MFVSRSHAAYITGVPGQPVHRPEGFEAELQRVVAQAYDSLDDAMEAEFGNFNYGGSTAVVALIIRDR